MSYSSLYLQHAPQCIDHVKLSTWQVGLTEKVVSIKEALSDM